MVGWGKRNNQDLKDGYEGGSRRRRERAADNQKVVSVSMLEWRGGFFVPRQSEPLSHQEIGPVYGAADLVLLTGDSGFAFSSAHAPTVDTGPA